MKTQQSSASKPRVAPNSNSPVEGLPEFRHHYADVNGTRIHYVLGGQGPTVVLLHGFPYSWAVWQPLMPLLVEKGFTVLAPDLRAMGDSSPAEGGFEKTSVAQDVREIVAKHKLGPINLVGADIGTMVAYAYASRHPHEVRRLVLTESLIPGFGLEELMNPATGGYWHFGFHMQAPLAAFLTHGKEAAYLMPAYNMMSANKDAEVTAASTFLPHYTGPAGLLGAFQHYAPLIEDGKANRAEFRSKMTMPVLVLNGDKGLPQAPLLAGIEQIATTVESDIVPESGHTLGIDNPQWLAERLSAFFNQA